MSQVAVRKKSSRTKVVRLSALNVAMHKPHSPERYKQLFVESFRLALRLKQGEVHGMLLGRLDQIDMQKSDEPFCGEIYRFINLDPNEPWFDQRSNKPASSTQMSEISIPENLLPHLQRIPFVFFPSDHKLVFVKNMNGSASVGGQNIRLGPTHAKLFFEALFSHQDLTVKFGQVNVTVIPSSEMVDEILSMPQLRQLSIFFTRPNGDDGENYSSKLKARLESQNAKSQTIVLSASPGQNLMPDAQTKDIAHGASNDGFVEGIGSSNAGRRIHSLTCKIPF